jgi:hypothetical protein
MGFISPVFKHLDLIKQAEDFLAKQEAASKPAAVKKTTITCVKGKLVTKVTAIKPTCPKGYKKK